MPVQPVPVVAEAGHWPVTGPLALNDGSLRESYQATDSVTFAAAMNGMIWWSIGECGETGASHVAPLVFERVIMMSAPLAPFFCCQARYRPFASAARKLSENVRNDGVARDCACWK